MAKEKELTLEDLMKEDVGSGLESYDPAEDNRIGFAKILQALSKEVTGDGYKAGSLINGSTKVTLAELNAEFQFIPIFYFKEYAIWDEDFNLVKRSLNKADFTPAELAWVDKTPPIAQESMNFVIVSVSDPASPLILSFSRTNAKTGLKFRSLLIDTTKIQNIPLYGAVYSTKVLKKVEGKYSWFTFDNVKYVKKIESLDLYKQLKGYHKDISTINFNKMLGEGSGDTKALPAKNETEVVVDPNAKY